MKRPKPDELFAPQAQKKARPVPYAFVLDALEPIEPTTRPMFGSLGVYVDDKIVLILRDKAPANPDNGLWVATTADQHASLREVLPSMRSITVLGHGVTGWQVLPSSSPDFEEEAMRAVKLILARDPRIGKVPNSKKPKGPREAKAAEATKSPKATKPAKAKKPANATKSAKATNPAKATKPAAAKAKGAQPAKKRAPAKKTAAR